MSVRLTVAAVGVAAAIAGLGGAAVYAATDSPGMGEAGPPGHHGDGPPPWGPPMRDNADAATVHSESVRQDGRGGYTTELTQVGVITALSADSMTVASTDGFSQAYTLPSTLKPTWAVNDRVLVRATRSGTTATVSSIGEAPRPSN